QRATSHDLIGEARRLIEGEGGGRLGQAGVMVALAGPDGRMLAANPVLRRRAMGDVGASARGKPFTELLGTGEDGRIRIAREGGESNPLRLVQVPLDGGGDDGAAILFFLLDEAGGTAVAGGTSTADLHALLGMLPLGLALADREGRFQYMNDAFRRAAGLGERERLVYPGDLVDKDDKAAVSNAVRRHASGALTSGDVAVTLKHRPEEPVALTIAGAQGLGDAAILLSLKDNSEDEKLKRQVAQATKMQAVGQLAGGVAHDFNNILTAIIGHCDMMLMRHSPGDSDYDDILQIKANSNRAAGLTRQLLAFSRQQTLRPQVVQLPDIVSEVSNLLKRLMGETVTLDVTHGRDLGPVRADPGQLEQVIVNLAVNARDAILAKGEGAGRLSIRTFAMPSAEVRAMASEVLPVGDYTAVAIADTGVGIAPGALGKIFEPFYTTKEVGKGTGLGLSTVYGIVKQSGGFIFADSQPGEGAEFIIYLPVHRAEAVQPSPSAPAAPPRREPAAELWGSGSVLIVEDEATVRAVAERALTRQGYQVATAEDGERAVERVAAGERFDLIVSDVVMPTLDGPAMARKVREIVPDVPVLFMSGYAEEQLRRSIDLDAVHFLAKPFSVQQLGEAVRAIIGARESD
ncbi:MAG: response regulator, partial [Sphingomonadaceae bacterium]|nr:response regulator [Sphingomonadaceae bacterium]